MLKLESIVKEYRTGDNIVTALKGVSIEFRENEFVSILGPSGCGKTTLLNIIGGLDKYTSGDLIINNITTKKYKDKDWDSYRNHSIGFVFQSYNLIPHQTVLSNVELALTLSGVSKKERRTRAIDALTKVGLSDQLHKKPNQMSGGQMQRVAIARALVNNPDILLADEPTGALDSETSTQIMQILSEIAKDKLVIMVTHNPELAEIYSTRIVKLLDGKIISDSMPVERADSENADNADNASSEVIMKRPQKTSMGFFTALALSMNNLLTKKARTLLTAFAGSIGIIGIALILSLSNGVQKYIDSVEEDTLSSYPISIEKQAIDITSFMTNMSTKQNETEAHNDNLIHTNQIMTDFMDTMLSEVSSNNLEAFRAYIESNRDIFDPLVTDIQYKYSTKMNVYRTDVNDGIYQVNPGQVYSSLGMRQSSGMGMGLQSSDVWQQMLNNDKLLEEQYDIVYGKMPASYNEVVLIVSENCEVTDYTLYTLGILDSSELSSAFKKMMMGQEASFPEPQTYSYEELTSIKFKLLVNSDYFEKRNGIWVDRSEDTDYIKEKLSNATELSIVGIIKPKSNAALSKVGGTIGYRSDLMEYLMNEVMNSEAVQDQINNPETDIFSGIKFSTDDEEEVKLTFDDVIAYISSLSREEQLQYNESINQMKSYGMTEEAIAEAFTAAMVKESTDATYDDNLNKLGASFPEKPSSINIYPKDFESKDKISNIITEYNKTVDDADQITYTDYVGLIMSSVSTIINAISYILISFVAISLIVSSIMIGIITYISVLERTKEIGVLRAIGASKKDISRVFNAETLIVGFTAGAMGILITELLLIPINAIIYSITDISGIAVLPPLAGVILVLISMFLTFVAGLIPSRIAAKKDPVVALRTE